jgi:hypothetical protein
MRCWRGCDAALSGGRLPSASGWAVRACVSQEARARASPAASSPAPQPRLSSRRRGAWATVRHPAVTARDARHAAVASVRIGLEHAVACLWRPAAMSLPRQAVGCATAGTCAAGAAWSPHAAGRAVHTPGCCCSAHVRMPLARCQRERRGRTLRSCSQGIRAGGHGRPPLRVSLLSHEPASVAHDALSLPPFFSGGRRLSRAPCSGLVTSGATAQRARLRQLIAAPAGKPDRAHECARNGSLVPVPRAGLAGRRGRLHAPGPARPCVEDTVLTLPGLRRVCTAIVARTQGTAFGICGLENQSHGTTHFVGTSPCCSRPLFSAGGRVHVLVAWPSTDEVSALHSGQALAECTRVTSQVACF